MAFHAQVLAVFLTLCAAAFGSGESHNAGSGAQAKATTKMMRNEQRKIRSESRLADGEQLGVEEDSEASDSLEAEQHEVGKAQPEARRVSMSAAGSMQVKKNLAQKSLSPKAKGPNGPTNAIANTHTGVPQDIINECCCKTPMQYFEPTVSGGWAAAVGLPAQFWQCTGPMLEYPQGRIDQICDILAVNCDEKLGAKNAMIKQSMCQACYDCSEAQTVGDTCFCYESSRLAHVDKRPGDPDPTCKAKCKKKDGKADTEKGRAEKLSAPLFCQIDPIKQPMVTAEGCLKTDPADPDESIMGPDGKPLNCYAKALLASECFCDNVLGYCFGGTWQQKDNFGLVCTA